MLVTLNTDGSYEIHTKKGGYAFWVSSNIGRFQKWGKLIECYSPAEAEMMAVINGLHFIRTHPELSRATKIIVNTDCEAVINAALNPHGLKKQKQKRLRMLRGFIQKYIGDFRGHYCEYEFRHVKAHKKSENAREYVNNWLDHHAKKGRKL